MREFFEGQTVYWNDPDEGNLSGYYSILDTKKDYNSEISEEDLELFDDRVLLIGTPYSEVEVYAEELDT